MNSQFTEEQKEYLNGFAAGSGLARLRLPTFKATLGLPAASSPPDVQPSPPEARAIHRAAQDTFIAQGRKLTPEEHAKRAKDPLQMWDELRRHAEEARFPKSTDVFLFKFHGLFYVAPAQDSFMCRLRFPGGVTHSHQLRGVARLAEQYGGGYADVTTRANLQIREIEPSNTVRLLEALHDLGIINRGAGADNIRNITASPTAGIDPAELIDTRPLARELHHYILNHPELYGLPRKFNIAFDGGSAVSSLEETNDIGFTAVRVGPGHPIAPGIYFRLALGGITGHLDFARDTGILLTPAQCTPVAAAIIRAFIDHGDRTDRRKARLKYVLDRMGIDAFLLDVERRLGASLPRFPFTDCEPRPSIDRLAHVGFHPQKQQGLHYAGVVLPVGRMTSSQMRALADIADRHGSGDIRLTVWQNLLIPDIPADRVDLVRSQIDSLALSTSASSIRAGLVACTGSAGCKYAAANTKQHALQIADYLEARVQLDQPINIHLTGCHHSCAQHYIGDIGLLATKVTIDEQTVEGYHLFVGGACAGQQEIGRELFRDVCADDLPMLIESMLRAYLEHRHSQEESFRDFVRRRSTEQLRELVDQQMAAA